MLTVLMIALCAFEFCDMATRSKADEVSGEHPGDAAFRPPQRMVRCAIIPSASSLLAETRST